MGAAVVVNVDIAVLARVGAGQTAGEMVGQLEVGAGAQVDAVAAAVGDRHIAAALARRLARYEADGAALGVAPVERTLRSAQDFDALDIEQVEICAGQAWIVDIVDVEPHAGLESRIEIRLAEATDVGDDRFAEGGRLGTQVHARRVVQDIRELGRALRLDLLRRERRDRDRRVLQFLLAVLRGHDDLGKLCGRLWRLCVLRHSEAAAQCTKRHKAAQPKPQGGNQARKPLHLTSPLDDWRPASYRNVPLFFVSRTNKFAVCKTSSPEESVCGPHATADGHKDPGTGLRWTTTDPVGSPPAKFEATAIDVQIHAVE